MAKKIILMGILAIALVFAMTVLGCENAPEDDGGNTITITGITLPDDCDAPISSGYPVRCYITDNVNNRLSVAGGTGFLSVGSDTVTIPFEDYKKPIADKPFENEPYKGKGEFWIMLCFMKKGTYDIQFYYTTGKALSEFNLNSNSPSSAYDVLPKYNFSSSKTTIPFSQFKRH